MSLRVPPGFRLRHLPETDSTNRVAMEAARAGEAAGLVVVADRQTSGRGRQGRGWFGAPGSSLLTSVMLRPGTAPAQAWVHTLVAGLAARDVAIAAGVEAAWLKWPNDLYLGERKAAGVLCELSAAGGTIDAVVLGLGLNLRAPPEGWPPAIETTATAIAEHGRDVPRGDALQALCAAIATWEARLASDGVAPVLRAAAAAMAPMLGREVHVPRRGGVLRAAVMGIGQNGALLVRDGDGEVHELLAGDVHLGPPRGDR